MRNSDEVTMMEGPTRSTIAGHRLGSVDGLTGTTDMDKHQQAKIRSGQRVLL